MKLIMNIAKIISFSIGGYLMFSCENTEPIVKSKGTDTLSIADNFLFNVPIISDTVYIDKQYNTDIRVELKGYSIDTIKIIKNEVTLVRDSNIISSGYFLHNEPEKIEFLIRTVKLGSDDTVYFKSKPLLFKSIENLSSQYVHPSVDNGKLKLTWKEFDKGHTQKYLVERWIIDNEFNLSDGEKKYYQKYEVENATFIDDYYVGEEADYKITIINDAGNKQDTWYYRKSKEQPTCSVTQNAAGGYKLHFSKCKYFNNFGQYYITDGYNYNPTFIQSSNQVEDTTLIVPDAKFGDYARFWIRFLPKRFPESFSEKDWYIYGKFLYAQYGLSCFSYESVTALDKNNVAYTKNGKVFKYNTANNQVLDSTVKQDANYNFISSTPNGKYVYAINQDINNSTIFFWSENFTLNPINKFQYTYIIPPVSNNLLTIMTIPSNYSSSKLAIYNVANGNLIYTTNYTGSTHYPTISPNGDYFFIYDINYLKLCRYRNNSFEVIWTESDWKKYYRSYYFNRLNNDLCYVWDDNKIFSIRRCSDFSVINSFSLEIESIVDIDYYSNRIMGYVSDKIVIYDLNSGNLIKQIPAKLSELFFYSNKTILLGNTIYNNHGIKYELNQ